MVAFAIRVVHVEVRRDRIVADVRVSEERFSRTTPRLIASLLPRYPHLLEHSCVNDRGPTFSAVAASTSMPHLLEHMSIENQVRSEERFGDARAFVGDACETADGVRTPSIDARDLAGEHRPIAGVRPPVGEVLGGRKGGGSYFGKTVWVNRAARLARVELSYADDLVALASLRDAARDLNEALRAMDFRDAASDSATRHGIS